MSRRLESGPLVLATHNPGKVGELEILLAAYPLQLRTAGGLGLEAPEEDGDSYRANARIKALAAARASGLPALADDTGLEVIALGGEPGVHTARRAHEQGGWAQAHAWLRDALQSRSIVLGSEEAAAVFHCALCLAWPDGHTVGTEGRWHGVIDWPPLEGPGFVPVFRPRPDGPVLPHRAEAFAALARKHLPSVRG
jgi:XTP/dITP diphosphohydrolase